MQAVLDSVIQLFWALFELAGSIGGLVLPLTPLVLWVAFWMFAVDWVALRSFLHKGGWVGLVLLAFAAILVWGCVAPPADGSHYVLGRTLDNFIGKTVYVTGLLCIMLLSGAVQLAGVVGPYPPKIEEPEPDTHHGH